MIQTLLKKSFIYPRLVVGIVLIVVTLILSGCGGADKSTDKTEPSEGNSVSPLQVSVISTSITPQENRLVLALWEGEERVATAQNVRLILRDPQTTEQPVLWEGTATNFSDYEIPYWVAWPDFPRAGAWLMDVETTLADGTMYRNVVGVNVFETPYGIGIGSPAPASQNRVWDGTTDLKSISSDPDPNPAFYELTIAEALQQEKPLLVAFTTPGLCQSKICAPVMRTVTPLWEQYGDAMNFIHVEVYADFETLEWVPTMQEWNLISEPWLYVIDRAGQVTMRLDGPVSPSELEPYLQAVLDD